VKQKPDNYDLLLRYLLGELTEEEQSRLESRYFKDDELFEELLLIENDLIESYARGELPESERRRIEKNFLKSSERRQKAILARSLMQYADEQPPPAQPEGVKLKRVSWWRDLFSLLRCGMA
jgi:anti-sigma factor RsiW